VLRITELLEECRKEIREIVRDNWDFRDLVGHRSEQVYIEGGIHVANAEYNVDRSQVGVVGPNAHVHDVTFEQRLEQEASSFDLKVLAEQLDLLQNELTKQATERDHYAAIVAVSDAAADARQNKGADAFAKLRAAGKWALDVATNIGANVAAQALKVALGLA
jgi:hypothetical protein